MHASLSDYTPQSHRRRQTTDLLYEGTVIGSLLRRLQQIVQNGRNDLERVYRISTVTTWMRCVVCSRQLHHWLEDPTKRNRLATLHR